METKFNLTLLKERYQSLKELYELPSFENLNEEFVIEKIAKYETDFILREIRVCMTNRFFEVMRFLESIINPIENSIILFGIIKCLGNNGKEQAIELYKKISPIEIESIKLTLNYSEKEEAETIKKYYSFWQEIKKEFMPIINTIIKNWDDKQEDKGKGYFG